MTAQPAATALIACWRYLRATDREKPSRRALYDAVNDLWAWSAFHEVANG